MRGDRSFALDESLRAYDVASDWFLERVRRVPDDRWDGPGLGDWTLRELVGHASRAYVTVEAYLAPRRPSRWPDRRSTSAGSWPDEGVNDAIAAQGPRGGLGPRGRSGGRGRGAAARAAPPSPPRPAGAVCATRIGTLSLGDFLATRVVELTLHGLDVDQALGRPDEEPPAPPAQMAVAIMSALVAGSSRAVLLRALTGRGGLPPRLQRLPVTPRSAGTALRRA